MPSVPAGSRPDSPGLNFETSDWTQVYGYHSWQCRHNAYRADGASGQFIVVVTEYEAVIATTSNTNKMRTILNLFGNYLLPAFK